MDGTSCLSAELVSKPDDDHKDMDKLISQCQPAVVAQHQKAAPPREPDGWFEYIEPPVEFQDYEAKLRAGEASIKRSSAPVKKHIELLKLEAIISSFVSKLVQSTFQEVWLLQRQRLQTGDTKPLAHTYVNLGAEVTPAIAEEPNARAVEVVQRKPVTVCHLFSLSEDVYNVPVDAIDPQQPVRRRKTAGRAKATLEDHSLIAVRVSRREKPASADLHKRHSLAYPMANKNEPIHMTLEEVRGYLKEMHRSPGNVLRRPLLRASSQSSNGLLDCRRSLMLPSSSLDDEGSSKPRKRHSLFFFHLWMKKTRSASSEASLGANSSLRRLELNSSLSINLKQVFCSVFKPKRTDNSVVTTSWTFSSPHQSSGVQPTAIHRSPAPSPSLNTNRRALPPVPSLPAVLGESVLSSTQSLSFVEAEESSPLTSVRGRSKASSFDFATSIEAVKDYGWYWGPLSGEAAEKILSAEPDGSFIVRDSSDDHYIFSLTFKLSGCIRHVRIEHDHGNFSFGSVTKFKSQTIVEFIEKAVEHSRSGRYLFFLHRRPVLGPMRVQLLHPVSRFKHVQSLQHLCRFVILRLVRRDHTDQLPLPKPLRDYLNSMQYFSETLERSQSPLRTVEHFV